MKTLVSLLLMVGFTMPLFAQLRIGTAGGMGINRMQMDDPVPLDRGEMPLQVALESELWLEYFVWPSWGIRLSGTAATQQRNQRIGVDGTGRVSGFILQRSWAAGISYTKQMENPPRLRIESFLQGGIRYNAITPPGCSGFNSTAVLDPQQDFITMATEYMEDDTTPTVPELRAGVGVSFPLFKYLTNIRMFIATEFRYSFTEVATMDARFATDRFPFNANDDFNEAAAEIRSSYPECQENLDDIPLDFDGSYRNTFSGHLLSVRAGLIFPIDWKKE